jgi:hypothetical protein
MRQSSALLLSLIAIVLSTIVNVKAMKDFDVVNADLSTLANQFHILQQAPSHYADEGSDRRQEWNDDVDAFESPMHRVMQELGERLGVPGTSAELVRETLGEANEYTSDLDQPFQTPPFMPGCVLFDIRYP